jgi:hypothetical protein
MFYPLRSRVEASFEISILTGTSTSPRRDFVLLRREKQMDLFRHFQKPSKICDLINHILIAWSIVESQTCSQLEQLENIARLARAGSGWGLLAVEMAKITPGAQQKLFDID